MVVRFYFQKQGFIHLEGFLYMGALAQGFFKKDKFKQVTSLNEVLRRELEYKGFIGIFGV